MVIALVLSGGTGTRFGSDIPKQYVEAGGKPVINYCIETLSRNDKIDGIVIMAVPEWQKRITRWISDADKNNKFLGFGLPGANRQLSVYNGLTTIKKMGIDEENTYVLVHDAVRPLLTDACIEACIKAVKGHDGVIPVLPMKDTVYLSTNGVSIKSLLNRNEVFAGQAPELFVFDKYLCANERLIRRIKKQNQSKLEISLLSQIMKINGSTEPAIIAGMDIVMIPGDDKNFKITTRGDLERFKALIDGGNTG